MYLITVWKVPVEKSANFIESMDLGPERGLLYLVHCGGVPVVGSPK